MHKKLTLILLLFVALLGTAFVSLGFGGSPIPFSKLMSAFFHPLNADATTSTILWHLRVPRILLALLVGMGLASSGCVFQGMLRNPLADPYTLGISGGAALGASVGILTGLTAVSIYLLPVSAFMGTLLCL